MDRNTELENELLRVNEEEDVMYKDKENLK